MGGTFQAMNKIRPGAYINFETSGGVTVSPGVRGVVLMPLPLNWGPDATMIALTAADLSNGNYQKYLGDTDSLAVELALYGASSLLVYKTNPSGTKANKALTDVTVTALYGGTFGNSISIGVAGGVVTTYVNGISVDEQTVTDYNELVANDYVTFDGDGDVDAVAVTALAGGANGSTVTTGFFAAAPFATWNTLAVVDDSLNASAIAMVKTLREDEGKYVQCVVSSTTGNDYEGVIQVKQSVMLDETTVDAEALTAYVAGITAGAYINESNTALSTPFTSVASEMTNAEVEAALTAGYFVFTRSASGGVKVEQDINSLTTFTDTHGSVFHKNRPLRVIDEIGNTITSTFETSYMGKASNNDRGRANFKATLVGYFNSLQDLDAIQNFTADDIVVSDGDDIDQVVVTAAIQPVDSMEKLYMTVTLS